MSPVDKAGTQAAIPRLRFGSRIDTRSIRGGKARDVDFGVHRGSGFPSHGIKDPRSIPGSASFIRGLLVIVGRRHKTF